MCPGRGSDVCIHLGGLGAGRLLAAELTRVGGARVRLICTAACALCCFTLARLLLIVSWSWRVECGARGTEFRPFMYVVGHLNYTIMVVIAYERLE